MACGQSKHPASKSLFFEFAILLRMSGPIGDFLSQRELVIDPIIGWRSWKIIRSYERLMLTSPTQRGFVWNPGQVMHAFCDHDTASRARGCSCGFYAFASKQDLLADPSYSRVDAIGPVHLMGEVSAHNKGFRAQQALIHGPLQVAGDWSDPELQALARDYNVEIVRRTLPALPTQQQRINGMQLTAVQKQSINRLVSLSTSAAVALEAVSQQWNTAGYQPHNREADRAVACLLYCAHVLGLEADDFESMVNYLLGYIDTNPWRAALVQATASQMARIDEPGRWLYSLLGDKVMVSNIRENLEKML